MGMYTALSLGVELNRELLRKMNHSVEPCCPADVLEYLVTGRRERAAHAYASQSLHPLFSSDRWPVLLRCDSYYFDYQTRWDFKYDSIAKHYFLSGVSNLKNYNNEIGKFLDWLKPFIITEGWIGWTMYEEDGLPTMLMNDRENFLIKKIRIDTHEVHSWEKEIML